MLASLSSLRAIAAALRVDVGSDAPVVGYSIDSRTIRAGELFFAVRGANTDGHRYVEQAMAAGAVGAVVERGSDPRFIVVADTLAALQALGAETRRRWGKHVVAVTGSAGKTTTKEMIAAVLSQRYRVRKTDGNFNNEYGLPLSLLQLQDADEVAVFELGMSHAGEIAALAKLAAPQTGVVTCVAPVHLEFFDSIDAVAEAKYELIAALPPSGTAVLNADDPRVAGFAFAGPRVTFGIEHAADFRAEDLRESDGTAFRLRETQFELSVPGRHQVRNALAAIVVGSLRGVSLHDASTALRHFRVAKMRGETLEWHGARLVNDCYNSNPQAALAMLDWLARAPAKGRRIAVLGEMLELGPAGVEMHREVGARAAQVADLVIGVRGLAREMAAPKGIFVETPEAAADLLRDCIAPGDIVLFKASRGVRLERALERLMEKAD